ncbi:helix-turn-helix domain-containing protein [Blastococcus goldschmidtiae]|uniref:XRE family transcriptional regulator n=1 Tax=Blastococcus goldschmidtiae TaxID=3075546 RepID=A0ABU2KD89_9ACTN|nr:XRE family transcriptional regulator [Blastococcus sp. DSM 46792]MDT0278160.1 XRE family transcriptional regulator [Blastococcus sp. DSM 46792]
MAVDSSTLGARIRDARDRAGLTQAELATATSLDRSSLAKIESGARRVSALELARIADAVGARIEWFLEEVAPAILSHRNREEPGAASPAIDALLERLARNVEFLQLHGNLPLADLDVIERPATDADADEAAARARSLLGLDEHEPVLDLDSASPAAGLLLFSIELGSDTADAASIALRSGGLAVVNGSQQVGRRRLAAAHELGHHLFADEYTIDWRVTAGIDAAPWEARVDRFARALLLPHLGVERTWRQLVDSSDALRVAAVRMASLFRVDMATLSRRLGELGLVTAGESRTIRQVSTTRADIIDYNLVPRDELASPTLPKPYIKAVLDLYRSDVIAAARAIDLLLDTWAEEDLPVPPQLSAEAVWGFVS